MSRSRAHPSGTRAVSRIGRRVRSLRPRRMAALVFALLTIAALGASATAQQVVADNEDRLLVDRTAQLSGLLESLGSTYETQMASVASIAQVTGGDPARFEAAIASFEGDSTRDWALLRRAGDGFVPVVVLGAVTLPADLPAGWSSGLANAADGTLTGLGFLGEGLQRRFALAMGQPGAGGDVIAYREIPLFAATSEAGGDDTAELLADVAIEVFVGAEPDPEHLLLAFGEGEASGAVQRRVVDVSGIELLLAVTPTGPLGGSVATRLPAFLLGGGLLLGLSIAAVVEMSQRRRDDAMATVRDLERQNRRLDAALAEQQAAEAARAAIEVELRQSQRLEAVGQLAGGVAHDFNNVLAAILSYADLAADATTDPAPLEDLRSIQDAARRGAGLTRQLLQFSRRESGEATTVDLNTRVTDVVSMLDRTLGENIVLSTRCSSQPALVEADPVELDQIILNLIVNARDAVGASGTIVVQTEQVELTRADVLNLPTVTPGAHVRVTVTDDGQGMSADVLDHAFEPFYTTKGRGQGTGLGLSTVYGIVQRQGGHVVARSEPGGGTVMEVLLPASTAPAEPASPVETVPTVAGGDGRTVLLVEDEDTLRRAVRRMLEGAGYAVVEAPDGRTALDHGAGGIDLLLTDIMMPGGLSGVDVADGLRAVSPRLPVVYMTGYSDTILDPERLDGSTTLLNKPFAEGELLDMVGSAIGVPA